VLAAVPTGQAGSNVFSQRPPTWSKPALSYALTIRLTSSSCARRAISARRRELDLSGQRDFRLALGFLRAREPLTA
jgi:hypothetical protein